MLDHFRNPLFAAVVGTLGSASAQSLAVPDPASTALPACAAVLPATDPAERPAL